MLKIFFESLGCDKNLVDSEKMLGLLSRAGYSFTDNEEEADVIIVNTCAFIGDAKEESIAEILRLANYKTDGGCKSLIATGCLAERYKDEIMKELLGCHNGSCGGYGQGPGEGRAIAACSVSKSGEAP